MHKIIYSNISKNDLNEIFLFISENSINNAEKVIHSIMKSINDLVIFPKLWKDIWWDLRLIINPRYRFKIIYQIFNQDIFIVNIYKNKNDFY